jgi:hypothetical protein
MKAVMFGKSNSTIQMEKKFGQIFVNLLPENRKFICGLE